MYFISVPGSSSLHKLFMEQKYLIQNILNAFCFWRVAF